MGKSFPEKVTSYNYKQYLQGMVDTERLGGIPDVCLAAGKNKN